MVTAQRAALLKKPENCHYCGTRLLASEVTRDHIVPKSKGGADAAWNLVPACKPCNVAKKDQWPKDHCKKCRQAKWRFENSPVRHVSRLTRGGIGPRCRTCGEITMTPANCPWCLTA